MKRPLRLAAAVALFGFTAAADDDLPWPVALKVGETIDICANGSIICPASAPLCDDLKVATLRVVLVNENGPKDKPSKTGLEVVGVGPGKTLCSAGSMNKLRRVYEVTVTTRDGGP